MATLPRSMRWLVVLLLLIASYYLGNYGLSLANGYSSAPVERSEILPAPPPTASSVVVTNPASRPPEDAAGALPLLQASVPRSFPDAQGAAFNAIAWQRPPAPVVVRPVAPAPPPAPSAPPLPYTFVGLLTQHNNSAPPKAFIAQGDSLLMVSAGDVLDNNTYRVDTITEQEVVITYLPMRTRHTLTVTGGTP